VGGQVFNRVENTEYSRAMTVVYTHEYPITLPMGGTGQMSRLNAHCLPINSTRTINGMTKCCYVR